MIAVALCALWVLGLATSYTMGGFVHLLLVLAILAVLYSIIEGRRLAPLPARGKTDRAIL